MVANEDDKNLREVKAFLKNLSQIGTDRFSGASTIDGKAQNLTRTSRTPASMARGREPSRGMRLGALGLATLAGGAILMLAADLFFKYWPGPPLDTAINSSPPAAAAVTAQVARQGSEDGAGTAGLNIPLAPPSLAVASAKQLLEAGSVAAARGMLQQRALASSQDAAWLLARSYDPNYLATIKSPDAPADKEKAAEWYRRWRDIGVERGVEIEDTRFKRLIETLD
jgi:hypothetical protein